MATRKTSSNINPVQVAALALKKVKTRADYNRIAAANTQDDFNAAWQLLSDEDRIRIHHLCSLGEPNLQDIAEQLIRCTTLIELQVVKASVGPEVAKQAWKLISAEDRLRLKSICQTEQQQPVTEQPEPQSESEWNGAYTQDLTEQWSKEQAQLQPQPKPRTLFSISEDLEKLNDLLDEVGGDAQQQELIQQWFETLGEERDRKLDAYAALITEITARSAVRKAESQRLQELAASDEARARLLKDRLKTFFETHHLKTVETARYKLSLAKNGGRQPLILKDGLSPTELPDQFQKISVDANTTAIREALERGEQLDFAQLGERGTSLRIK